MTYVEAIEEQKRKILSLSVNTMRLRDVANNSEKVHWNQAKKALNEAWQSLDKLHNAMEGTVRGNLALKGGD